ncbi:hypothetical protein L3X38_002377 [Prunus dulcis]|uniref:Uncharacterized protein n=1 Tax=Prunus dulcis TaxID=3755 RepID=A0AAD4WTT4_PRUDU|nr:hypothetical protein L3X38_002377 [Prunus dulcis]
MWEGRQLLGTIFVRWRRKHCLDNCVFCFVSLTFDKIILPSAFVFFEFWTRLIPTGTIGRVAHGKSTIVKAISGVQVIIPSCI